MWERIIPSVLVQRTVFCRANCVFPLITCSQISAFNDTTARETEYAWMQVGKVFYEVGTHTLPAVCREKTHMVDVNTLAAFKENAEQSLFNGLVRSERCRVFLPFVARHSDCSLADRTVFFVDKLIDMGAQIMLCDPHRAVVIGLGKSHQLRAAKMASPDIRAGIALLIAAMSAEGTSIINNIEQIDRGYQDIAGRLNALGAHISRL